MISVIIPTYKNRAGFLKNLRHNLPYLKGMEIVVINDDPESTLKSELRSFKDIILIENRHNLGFGRSINQGVKKSKYPFLMLLNDDVLLQDSSFTDSLVYFKKNQLLFAVSFAQKEKDGTVVGHNEIFWKNGLFFHKKSVSKNIFNAWAEGGACIIEKKKFEELEGFDALYAPFYWEDIDISYRAWKSGYTILFDPKILVIHHHESTIGKYFNASSVKTIAFRNQFIFIWKNITDSRLALIHWVLLPFNLLYYGLKGEWSFLKGLAKAIPLLPIIKKSQYPISDSAIFKKFR